MITINDFVKMNDTDKCNLVNKHLQNHTQKNFKQGEIVFTYRQADKVFSDCGLYYLEGAYRTSEQALQFIENKKKEQDRKSFTPEQIEKLIALASCENFDNLLLLAERYNYVSYYILHEINDIHIRTGNGSIKQTSARVYEDTWEKWKSYTAKNKEYNALNLLNTALLEFMDHHPID